MTGPADAWDAVFFDLDGTLADTAPDLGGALNRVRIEEGCAALELDVLRRVTSQGVRGLLRVGFGIAPGDPTYAPLAARVLAHYSESLCVGTRLFGGVAELLADIESSGMRWGVVTNKAARFTIPVMNGLGLLYRAASVVSGDSAPQPKPAAAPLLLACAIAGANPSRCMYIGDDLRDVQAGRACGMTTVAVRYGYHGDGPPIDDWGADHLVDQPLQIAQLLGIEGAKMRS